MELKFWDAARGGNVQEVKEILRDHPSIDVNWGHEDWEGLSAIHCACGLDHEAIVSILLAHPDIDVNQANVMGYTPFMSACDGGRVSSVRLLLRDSRVDVNQPDLDGFSPLSNASYFGFVEIIKWWIVSGREMDLGEPGNTQTDAIAAATEQGHTDVVDLLERFQENPEETRYGLRMEVGLHEDVAVEIFAITVFASDGLLQVKKNNYVAKPTPAARFFGIATQLPLELQMVLCHRFVGSAKEIILAMRSEVAFRELAKRI